MDLIAPAKLNLFLKVLNKRDDGYHEIDTVFESISLYDRLCIDIISGSDKITCSDPSVPVDKESLIGKTISAFRRETGCKTNFSVHIDKHIPIGAGLGGGSSDAAAVLKGLNDLTDHFLQKNDLLRLGSELGADVPFFLSEHRFGQGKGRGDIISHINTNVKLWHILINPGFEISTKKVYGEISPFSLTKEWSVDTMVSTFSDGNIAESIAKNLYNDLQLIALRDFPVLEEILLELKNSGAMGVLLSGSGPTCFGVFEEKHVKKAAERLKKVFSKEKNWKILIVHTHQTEAEDG